MRLFFYHHDRHWEDGMECINPLLVAPSPPLQNEYLLAAEVKAYGGLPAVESVKQ